MYSRWTWARAEEDISKMGKLALGEVFGPHRGPLRRPARRKDVDKTSGDPVRRASATTHQGKDAYPLSGERWQSTSVSARTTCPPRKHGFPRHRRRKPPTNPRSHMDHHSEIPNPGYHDRGDRQPRNQERQGRSVALVSNEDRWLSQCER